ncbi:MAG TPA: hypothetical protein V6D18_20425 [Thermosynechococcaceae cyanobacterium]
MRSVRAFFSSFGLDADQSSCRSFPWLIAAIAGILLTGGAGFWGYSMLMRLPEFSSCRSINWDDEDSPAMRLQCAQTIASTRQMDDLLEGIRLAQTIPAEQPALRRDSDRLIQQWSQELAGMADDAFHAGSLEEAIRIARRLPLSVSRSQDLDDRIRKWQVAWSKAEEIYKDTEMQVSQENWTQAFGLAKTLLSVGNTYWATTKYQALLTMIQEAKEGKNDQSKNNQSKTAKSDKSLKSSNPKFATDRKPLPTAEDLITKWQRDQDAKDQAHLARARSLAQSGKPEELQAAMDEARRVLYGNANYTEAQRLIDSWSRQSATAEDRAYLDRANRLASKGDADSLREAISETYRISSDRPLSVEARDKAEQWNQQIQQLRSQPRSTDPYIPIPPSVLPRNSPSATPVTR